MIIKGENFSKPLVKREPSVGNKIKGYFALILFPLMVLFSDNLYIIGYNVEIVCSGIICSNCQRIGYKDYAKPLKSASTLFV